MMRESDSPIAHMTFSGGGMMLPASTPYEREVLREYLLDRALRTERVQLRARGKTWSVERCSPKQPRTCSRCKRHLAAAALHAPGSTTDYCVPCALS